MTKTYAVVDDKGICIGVKQVGDEIAKPDHMELPDYDESILGKRWNGAKWVVTAKAKRDAARERLAEIDRSTGAPRAVREALIALGQKVGAPMPGLEAAEAEAVTLRVDAA